MTARILGVDLGVRAADVANMCDEPDAVIWTGRRPQTRCDELPSFSAGSMTLESCRAADGCVEGSPSDPCSAEN